MIGTYQHWLLHLFEIWISWDVIVMFLIHHFYPMNFNLYFHLQILTITDIVNSLEKVHRISSDTPLSVCKHFLDSLLWCCLIDYYNFCHVVRRKSQRRWFYYHRTLAQSDMIFIPVLRRVDLVLSICKYYITISWGIIYSFDVCKRQSETISLNLLNNLYFSPEPRIMCISLVIWSKSIFGACLVQHYESLSPCLHSWDH